MRETTTSEIERINVIILVLGSLASLAVMRDFQHFFSFAVASSIMTLNFRYLRKIMEAFSPGLPPFGMLQTFRPARSRVEGRAFYQAAPQVPCPYRPGGHRHPLGECQHRLFYHRSVDGVIVHNYQPGRRRVWPGSKEERRWDMSSSPGFPSFRASPSYPLRRQQPDRFRRAGRARCPRLCPAQEGPRTR